MNSFWQVFVYFYVLCQAFFLKHIKYKKLPKSVTVSWKEFIITDKFKTKMPSSLQVTGVNPGGGGGCIPPTFLGGGGMACTNIPPPTLFEDKITLNLTCILKKLTFLTVKLLKTPKVARSLHSLAHKCILRLDLCGFASTCILFLTSLCKERRRIK